MSSPAIYCFFTVVPVPEPPEIVTSIVLPVRDAVTELPIKFIVSTSPEVPKLRIKNKYEDHILYIEPTVAADCIPSGYELFEECIVIILPTTK